MAVKIENIEWEVKDSNETDGKVIVHPVTDADVVNFTPPSGMSSTDVQSAIVEVKNAIPTIPTSLPANGGNADTVDNLHATDFARVGEHNNLTASGNEFTFASNGFSGDIYLNYRTAGGTNGNITGYILGNGRGGSLGTAIHTGNISSYIPSVPSYSGNYLHIVEIVTGYPGVISGSGAAIVLFIRKSSSAALDTWAKIYSNYSSLGNYNYPVIAGHYNSSGTREPVCGISGIYDNRIIIYYKYTSGYYSTTITLYSSEMTIRDNVIPLM